MSFVGSNRIAFQRNKKKWSQAKLAESLGVHWVTISKLERGRMRLTQEWLVRIAGALDVHPSELMPDDEDAYEFELDGVIRDGTTIVKDFQAVETQINFGGDDEMHSEWFQFADNSAAPSFREGDKLRFIHWGAYISEELIGRICLIWDERRNSRVIGVLGYGLTRESFDLKPFNGAALRNVPHQLVEVAVEVRYAVRTPRELKDSAMS